MSLFFQASTQIYTNYSIICFLIRSVYNLEQNLTFKIYQLDCKFNEEELPPVTFSVVLSMFIQHSDLDTFPIIACSNKWEKGTGEWMNLGFDGQNEGKTISCQLSPMENIER